MATNSPIPIGLWEALPHERQDEICRKLQIYFCKKRVRQPELLVKESIARLSETPNGGSPLTADVMRLVLALAQDVWTEHVNALQGIDPDKECAAGAARLEVVRDFWRRLERLPEKDRKILSRFCEGDSEARAELARNLGMSRSALGLLICKLRAQLQAEAETPK